MTQGLPMKRCLLLALLMSLPASAALAKTSEPAMVSKAGGKDITWQHGDTSAKPGVQTLLAPGDRISVGKGSFVEVEYLADNCKVRVDAGGSIVVGETSPCAAKANAETAAPQEPKIVPAATGAVEVSSKNGPLTQVNRGEGLVEAKVGDALKVGDEVFAGAGSSVTLYFAASNCTYTVPAGTYLKISSQVPCQAPAAAQNGTPAPLPEGVPPGVLVGAGVGALALGGAIVVIISNQDDNNNNNPATPD